ncbi:MAG TPA: outer membrane lipoprotein carrier protein LolA [Trebonia sp.]
MPAAALVVTGGIIGGLQIPAAQASPSLPPRTPAQLLADISQDQKVPPLTGTVVETTSLGLPQLPNASNPTSLASLLTGSHTLKVYYQNPQHFRLSVPQTMSETDVIRNGNTVWLWDSSQNSVTEITAPPKAAEHSAEQQLPTATLTPQQAANAILKAVGKTTTVGVQSNVMVAGDPAYQLTLAPKDHRSLIGRVQIAVDAKYGIPLRVQVFAKGASSPAFQVGYTALSFTAPAAANLAFTPPPGAKVDKTNLSDHAAQQQSGQLPAGSGFGSYGKGWLTVASLPQSDLFSSFGTGPGASRAPASSSAGSNVLGGDSQQVLSALLGAAKPVSGSWGSGTLLQTSLVSVLMAGGKVYIGAVQPSVLYAAVGHTS